MWSREQTHTSSRWAWPTGYHDLRRKPGAPRGGWRTEEDRDRPKGRGTTKRRRQNRHVEDEKDTGHGDRHRHGAHHIALGPGARAVRVQFRRMRALERRFARSCGGGRALRTASSRRTGCEPGARATPGRPARRARGLRGDRAHRPEHPFCARQWPESGPRGIRGNLSTHRKARWTAGPASVFVRASVRALLVGAVTAPLLPADPSPPAQIPRHDDGRSQRRVVPPWDSRLPERGRHASPRPISP